MSQVTITTRGDRGFHQYGDPVVCSYGSKVKVYESSSAEGPHVWLTVAVNPDILSRQLYGEGAAHLSEDQAREVVARLQAWLDEIPSRWDRAE